MMIKRSLLAASIAALSAQMAYAAPFMPLDARGMAMGNTGVASAKLAHAPAYNPSLLSQARPNDDFAILFPQLGFQLTDEQMAIKKAQDIGDITIPKFEDQVNDSPTSLTNRLDELNEAVNDLQTTINELNGLSDANQIKDKYTELKANNLALEDASNNLKSSLTTFQSTTDELTSSLRSISDNPLAARLGVSGVVAVPSKKLAVAVSASGNAIVSGRITFAENDLGLFDAYIDASNGLLNEVSGDGGSNLGLTGNLNNAFTNAEDANGDLDAAKVNQHTKRDLQPL